MPGKGGVEVWFQRRHSVAGLRRTLRHIEDLPSLAPVFAIPIIAAVIDSW